MRIRTLLLLAASLSCTLVPITLSGCGGNGRVGENIGIGAIAGRGIGSTASRNALRSGEDVGVGIGYLITDDQDRARAATMSRQTSASNYTHRELGALTNTRWEVRSITPSRAAGENLGMVVTFRPSGHAVTRTVMPDSTTRLVNERYRVVDDTLILNSDDYIVNAQFRIRGETLTIAAGEFVAVFDRLRSRDGL